jgi:hypothetical protein
MSGRRRALLVGINEFGHLPRSNWLNGCVNDAQDMAGFVHGLGFDQADVSVLTDGQATKAAVMGGLTELVDRAAAGELDHLVFSFSSHGTQVPDRDGDEVDGVDEALATYDIDAAGDDWDRGTVIVDDELHELFARLPENVLTEVFIDTCHSGTGLRALDLLVGRRPKFLPPPTADGLDAVDGHEPRSLRELTGRGGAGAPVLLAACSASQTAADAHFGGRYNGAFTYYLLDALRTRPTASRRELLALVRGSLREGRFAQTPQLEAQRALKDAAVGSVPASAPVR